MRKWLIIAAAVLQGLALAYIGAKREYVVLTGRTVYLRTAPVDPRDLFRGDYVRLRYEASTIPRHVLAGDLADDLASEDKNTRTRRRSRRVYATLKADEGGLAEVVAVSDRKPDDGLFIRGWTEPGRWINTLRVKYGLEAYFVQQGKGLELEKQRSRDGIQVPLEMEVALGTNGMAVIKGHRWAPLGIGVEIEQEEVANDRGQQERRAVAAKLRLLNSSEKPLAIVDLPGGRSFSLEQVQTWSGKRDWYWVSKEDVRPKANDSHVHVLQPGKAYNIRIDLMDETWFVIGDDGKAVPLAALPRWDTRFRLVYRPPSSKQCQNLNQANLIWHGRLPSRTFSGGGRVD